MVELPIPDKDNIAILEIKSLLEFSQAVTPFMNLLTVHKNLN